MLFSDFSPIPSDNEIFNMYRTVLVRIQVGIQINSSNSKEIWSGELVVQVLEDYSVHELHYETPGMSLGIWGQQDTVHEIQDLQKFQGLVMRLRTDMGQCLEKNIRVEKNYTRKVMTHVRYYQPSYSLHWHTGRTRTLEGMNFLLQLMKV